VQVLDAHATLAAVRDGAAHVGVLPLDAVPEDLHARVLARVPFVVVMPRRHPLARRRNVRASDLRDVALVLPPSGRPHRVTIERFLAAEAIEPVIGAEAMGWAVLSKLAAIGVGVAIVPARTAIPRGAVERKLVGFPELTYRVVRRKRASVPAHVDAFFETLRAAGAASPSP
jgi:DNA-binding transcriptional LysR family regulator